MPAESTAPFKHKGSAPSGRPLGSRSSWPWTRIAWRVAKTRTGIVARGGGTLVSVTVFPLRRPYRPSQFDAAVVELDRVADKLAAQAGAAVSERVTTTVAGRRIRAYRYAHTRVGFVLADRREYELLCVGQSDACALLFSSFALS